jgi:hypothetical protein
MEEETLIREARALLAQKTQLNAIEAESRNNAGRCGATRPNRSLPPLAQPIEASFAKPDLNAPTSVSISASVIGVENVHVPVLMMLQPSS